MLRRLRDPLAHGADGLGAVLAVQAVNDLLDGLALLIFEAPLVLRGADAAVSPEHGLGLGQQPAGDLGHVGRELAQRAVGPLGVVLDVIMHHRHHLAARLRDVGPARLDRHGVQLRQALAESARHRLGALEERVRLGREPAEVVRQHPLFQAHRVERLQVGPERPAGVVHGDRPGQGLAEAACQYRRGAASPRPYRAGQDEDRQFDRGRGLVPPAQILEELGRLPARHRVAPAPVIRHVHQRHHVAARLARLAQELDHPRVGVLLGREHRHHHVARLADALGQLPVLLDNRVDVRRVQQH